MTHHNEKEIKWPEPGKLLPGLYIVATPIGNLRDITIRALDTLKAVDKIACEDTRVSGKLMKAYDISTPRFSYNDHSDDKKRASILNDIAEGRSVALISDAGCPLISDPGYKLVRDVMEQGLPVTSIPGASAVITGLQLSGLPSDSFSFIGFLPSKQKARKDALADWVHTKATLIAYETGPRLIASLKDVRDVLGERSVAVARELTKMYEEIRLESISHLIEFYEVGGAPKGEIVLIIEGAKEKKWSDHDIETELMKALKSMKTKDAANHVATLSKRAKKEIYEVALKLRGSDG